MADTTATKAQATAVIGALVTAFQAYQSLKTGATVEDWVTPGLTAFGTVLSTFAVYWLPNLRKTVAHVADEVEHYAGDVATVAKDVAEVAGDVSDELTDPADPGYDAEPVEGEPEPVEEPKAA